MNTNLSAQEIELITEARKEHSRTIQINSTHLEGFITKPVGPAVKRERNPFGVRYLKKGTPIGFRYRGHSSEIEVVAPLRAN